MEFSEIYDINITQMISEIAFLFFVAKRKKIYIPGLENNKHLRKYAKISGINPRCLLFSNPGI